MLQIRRENERGGLLAAKEVPGEHFSSGVVRYDVNLVQNVERMMR